MPIPTDQNPVPPVPRREKAVEFLKTLLPNAEEINARVTEELEFVDCGENLERIQCPSCSKELDHEWWLDTMDRAGADKFRDLSVTLACCHQPTTLNNLVYDWPQGFAHFVLEVMNPDIGDFEASEVTRVGELLGCPIRMIRAHI